MTRLFLFVCDIAAVLPLLCQTFLIRLQEARKIPEGIRSVAIS